MAAGDVGAARDEGPDVGGLFGSTAAWMLDDRVVHTNHGSFGAITRATQDAVEEARRTMAANPMRAFDREFFGLHVRAVEAVAGLVGARPADTALVPNATVGMDVGLRVLPWQRDATIVASDQVYESVRFNVRSRAAASGTSIRVVATDPAEPVDAVERLVAALDEAGAAGGPVGLVVDQFASATAMPLDVGRLVAEARDRDVPVVVDAAHAPGQIDPPAADPGADAWTGNLHKWACAPPSLGVLVVAEHHHDVIGSVVPSWFDDEPFPANSRWQGTADPGPMLVAEQVVAQARAILAHGHEIESLAVAGAQHLAAAVDGAVLPGDGWMRAVLLPERAGRGTAEAARAIERCLWQAGVEAKVTPSPASRGPTHDRLVLRLSAHAYTNPDDHARLAEALADALP